MTPAQRRIQRRVARAQRGWHGTRLFVWFLLPLLPLFAIVPAFIAAIIYVTYASELKDPTTVLAYQNVSGAKIYDRNGVLLYEFPDPSGGFRDPVPLDKVSGHAINATIATEDQSFWENPGVNVRGIARAAYENFFPGEGEFLGGSGGSSITQQLVKNTFIAPEERSKRSITRKIEEAVLSLELTRKLPKEQILEAYLNNVFYGHNAYGIQAAARQYFGKRASDLTLAEAALLAGLPQSPSRYDPYTRLESAKARQRQVLDLMVEARMISPADADAAWAEEIHLRPPTVEIKAPHFVFHVRDVLLRMYGEQVVYRGGLRVVTTLDYNLQQRAEGILNEHLTRLEAQRNCGCNNGAVVILDNRTGAILAMVGSRNYFDESIDGEVDNVTRAINHPGSAFKPIVYLTAFLELGWVPATKVHDVPTSFVVEDGSAPPFSPLNATQRSYGTMPVRRALGGSLNVPANRTAAAVGTDKIVDVAHRMGITTLRSQGYGPAIATGGADLYMIDLAYAYSVFANNGKMLGTPATQDYGDGFRELDPASILTVTDSRGKVLYSYEKPQEKQVVPAPYAYLVTDILKDDSARSWIFGPGSAFNLDRPAAAKSGTQQHHTVLSAVQEVWTFGFTPDLTTGVWIGRTDDAPLRGSVESSNTAAPLWHDIMIEAHSLLRLPPRDFVTPDGVEFGIVCERLDIYVKGSQPVCEEPAKGSRIVIGANGKIVSSEGGPLTRPATPEAVGPDTGSVPREPGTRWPTRTPSTPGPSAGATTPVPTRPPSATQPPAEPTRPPPPPPTPTKPAPSATRPPAEPTGPPATQQPPPEPTRGSAPSELEPSSTPPPSPQETQAAPSGGASTATPTPSPPATSQSATPAGGTPTGDGPHGGDR